MSPPKATIYIVEDEALIAMEIKDRLESMGYEVCGRASRASKALEEIPEKKPQLVLMDIRLDGEASGIELARRLRELVDVPVVFLSAFSDDALIREAVSAAPFGYLVKPFRERELTATIQTVLAKHRSEVALREDNARKDELLRRAGPGSRGKTS